MNGKKLFLLVVMSLLLALPIAHESQTSQAEAAAQTQAIKAETDLEQQIDRILQDKRLEGAISGVHVRRASDGKTLYQHDADIRLRPASNMKLLTGSAALDVLGPDYRFKTEVLSDGKVRGKVLQGNIYLRGKGDPTLMKEDLDKFAKVLRKQGIQKIHGDLIADDTRYDDIRYSQDLNWSDESNYVGAQVSALTLSPNEDYDAGTVIVDVNPAKRTGSKPTVSLTPKTDYVKIINKAKTVGKNEAKHISIEREHGTNNIVVSGQIPAEASSSRAWVAVWEPTGYALDVFKKSLQAQGIKQIGNSKIRSGKTPKHAKKLTDKRSMPLADLYIPFMKLSNNGHAEVLIKEMGKVVRHDGSWDAGLDVLQDKLQEFGLNTDTIMLRDGSGMSHKDMIPASELTKLLYVIQDQKWFPAFEKALPVAGESDRLVGGTLRNRMTGDATKGNVKAKTGSITGVSTLSGYVTSKDGEKLTFSILTNNYIDGPITPIEDQIATVLAGVNVK
ncbi:D-alanyl-D-alanine carboxypeptidase/D-alanyl-D-alanine-endopeptidase [Virgibacillus halophilus]|uniref:D-alanyl-D-alanine carboxypeptidase/D-alanyl-D-alanine endopeptidase n=1 Tax=Tigheibacillus halophilus TaxID=361280 RepID=UPI0036F30DAA